MTINIPDHYVISFTTNQELLLQQKISTLRDCVEQQTCMGKSAAVVDQYGEVEVRDITSRLQPKQRSDINVDRRWVYPLDRSVTQYADTFDKLRLLTDPQGKMVEASAAAIGRKYDDVIIGAFFGDARTGEQGGNTETFGTGLTTAAGNNVSVGVGGAASGLNVAKIIEGITTLGSRFVDLDNDPIYMGVTSRQHQNLLNETQIISSDFNGGQRPVLQDGKVRMFLGVNFKICERFQTGTDDAAGTSRACPMWAKSGMVLGTWQSPTSTITPDYTLEGNPYQIYTMFTIGATRKELDKVLRVWCRE